MSNYLNNENVRVVGSMHDAIWVAPLGTPDPVITSVDDLQGEALADILEALGAENVGWLNQDGIPLGVSANNEEMYGHQGGSLLRTKVTQTSKTLTIGALEESPLVTGMFFDHAAPTTLVEGVAKVDLPKGIGTVAKKFYVPVYDDDVAKLLVFSRGEIADREDIAHTNSAITGYTMTAKLTGEAYFLTNSASYVEAAKANG